LQRVLGMTHAEVCQSVDDSRQKYEHLAIGFYAAGGALVTASVIALVAGRPAPSSNSRTGLLGCALAGAGLNCAGRF